MEEIINKNQVDFQEYECGQKGNIYRFDTKTDFVNISTRKKARTTSIMCLFRAFFYPDNYPLGVSSDYGIYQLYNIIQTGCIAISGALAFSALFRGMGVGESSSNSLAASIVWLLKDGAGMLGRIIFTWGYATSLDANCKRWHFFGDILNDIACTLDLITPYFQTILLLITSISNICRSIALVIHGSTRTVIFQHQARNNNVADITAKCSSLETMISLIALFMNVLLLSILPSHLIWPLFLILTCGHLWANYQAKRCILFNVFNHSRFHLICSKYFQSSGQEILSIEQVNKQESIVFPTSISYHSHIGISLNHLPKSIIPSQIQLKTFHSNDFNRFLLIYDKTNHTFYALLKPYADTDDIIRLYFFIEILSYTIKSTIIKQVNNQFEIFIQRIQNQLPNFEHCFDILHENNDYFYQQFKQICIQHGYNFHRCLFNIDVFRIH